MKLLLLPAYFFPETAASGYLSENRNQAFVEAGFDVELYVPAPCRGISPDVRAEYCKKEHRCEKMYDGRMVVHRFSMYSEGKNPIARAFRYVFCWIKQFYYGLKAKDVNCIYLASTPPIQGVLGACLKKIKKVPFVYNLQDIFPDSLAGTGLTNKGSLLWKIGRVIENFTYKHADKIIVISEDFKKNIMAKGVPEDKRAYITAKEIVDKYWQYYFMAPDGRILCEGETPYDYKDHPFTLSLFPYVNGEIHSFIGFFIDQQRYINRSMMMYDLALKNAAKGMTFLPLSLKPDGMSREEYANQKTKFDSVFVYDDTKSRTGAKPEFYSHSAANLGQADMLQIQLNMIHEVSGVSGALQGKAPTSGTSAARYAMESQNATTTIYPLIKKFNGFEERIAQKKCITMQQFYEEGRDITPRKSEKQVFYRANAARNVKFNVSIKNSASSAAFLQLGNEMLDKLLNMQAIDVRTYLKNYDAPFAEKLLQDYDEYISQIQQGNMNAQPPQVPGANQQNVAAAMDAMRGGGNIYTRQQAGAPRTETNVA